MAPSAWEQVFQVLGVVLGAALTAYAFIIATACSWAVTIATLAPNPWHVLYFAVAVACGVGSLRHRFTDSRSRHPRLKAIRTASVVASQPAIPHLRPVIVCLLLLPVVRTFLALALLV